MRTAVVVFAVCALVACASTAWSKPGSLPGTHVEGAVEEDFQTHYGFGQVAFLVQEGYVVMQDHWYPYDWSDIVVFKHSLAQPGWTDMEMVCHLNPAWDALVQAVNASQNKTFEPEGTDGTCIYYPDGPAYNNPAYAFTSEGEPYVPEPASITVLGLGLLAMVRRRRSA